MVDRRLFNTGANPPVTRNAAGGLAYRLPDEHALAQYALTGCLNNTFYSSATDQLNKVIELWTCPLDVDG